MSAKLTDRMEDLVPRLGTFLNRIAADVSETPELKTGEGPFGIPMNHLMVGRGRSERRDDLLVLALNQALHENGQFLDHEPVPRGDSPDAPYAFVAVQHNRVSGRGALTKSEDMFHVYTNNPVMLAENFPKIGARAIEIAEEIGPRRRGPSDSGFQGL